MKKRVGDSLDIEAWEHILDLLFNDPFCERVFGSKSLSGGQFQISVSKVEKKKAESIIDIFVHRKTPDLLTVRLRTRNNKIYAMDSQCGRIGSRYLGVFSACYLFRGDGAITVFDEPSFKGESKALSSNTAVEVENRFIGEPRGPSAKQIYVNGNIGYVDFPYIYEVRTNYRLLINQYWTGSPYAIHYSSLVDSTLFEWPGGPPMSGNLVTKKTVLRFAEAIKTDEIVWVYVKPVTGVFYGWIRESQLQRIEYQERESIAPVW